MFARFSFSLSRIFRFRSRRGPKADVGSAGVARWSFSGFPSSKLHRPLSSQLEPINTAPAASVTRPRSLFIRSLLTPIAQSPITASHGTAPIPDTQTPILIIGRDPAQSALPSPTTPVLPGDDGLQTHDNASPLEPPLASTHLQSHRVSFQVPPPHTEEPPPSPVSMCSTLIPDSGIEPAVAPEQFRTPGVPDSGSARAASAEPGGGLGNAVRAGSGRVRPVSLFSPQPVRVNVNRFSLPVTPTAPMVTASPIAKNTKRESKLESWWNRELSKPETQQALTVLRWI